MKKIIFLFIYYGPEVIFSDFCIQLLSSLEGLAFDDQNRPSFGQIFDAAKRKKTPLQGTKKEQGKPF